MPLPVHVIVEFKNLAESTGRVSHVYVNQALDCNKNVTYIESIVCFNRSFQFETDYNSHLHVYI